MTPMRGRIARLVLASSLLVTVACASPEGRVGLETFGRGVANLMLSPFMIVTGLAQGLAFLPYTIGMGLTELNQALLQANAVPLDDAYKATFNVSIADKAVNPESGEIAGQDGLYGRYKPQAIVEATRAFQRLLVSQGMSEERARHYVLAGNYDYAWTRGQILLAVVYRHPGAQPIRPTSRTTGIVTTFRPDQRAWYAPYERDVRGEAIDEVIDWAALEYAALRHDKVVATLMVLAAEAVKEDRRSHDYWPAERRWRAGETTAIMRESADKVKRALAS